VSPSDNAAVEAGIDWLRAQVNVATYAKVSILVQVVHGQVAKVLKSVEDNVLPSAPTANGRAQHAGR